MSSRLLLILAAALIVGVWQLPYGHQVLYPLTLLATYAHELGHGVAAMIAGGEFERLLLYPDGSGLAIWRGASGRLPTVSISAGGLLGPSVTGAILLALSRTALHVRIVLALLAIFLVLSVVLWLGNLFGAIFLLAVAAGLGLGAWYLPKPGAAFLLHVMGLTLCLSLFNDLDYMFSDQAVVDGVTHLSDTAIIAETLWLPYWFWGTLVAMLSLSMSVIGILFVSRGSIEK